MNTETILFTYVLILLAGLIILALFSELQNRRFRPGRSPDRVFRCDKCGSVYTDDADVDRSRCAQCGTLNDAVRF